MTLRMSLDEAKKALKEGGFHVKEERRLPNDSGTQLRLRNGVVVNAYDTGTLIVQGKGHEPVSKALEKSAPSSTSESGVLPPTASKVFVAYGHDRAARTQVEAMLRRWGLEPLLLDQLASEGQTIIEKLESYTEGANFAVVLATPDDKGHRAEHPEEMAFRARQNVVLELGMLLAKFGRRKVAVLLKQQENMERPSDIQGLIYIPFKDDLEKDAGVLLAKEMCAQGYDIAVAKL